MAKIAGSFFKDEEDRKESVINITLDDAEVDEVTFAVQDASVMICVDLDDLLRVVEMLKAERSK